jgi:hypothetical protein
MSTLKSTPASEIILQRETQKRVAEILADCKDKGISYIHSDGKTWVQICAENKEDNVVDILIKEHGANINHAMLGSAKADDDKRVLYLLKGIPLNDNTIARGGLKFALAGYAIAKNPGKVSNLILTIKKNLLQDQIKRTEQNPNKAKEIAAEVEQNIASALSLAAWGYAVVGEHAEVDKLVAEGADINTVLDAYCLVKNNDKIFEFNDKAGSTGQSTNVMLRVSAAVSNSLLTSALLGIKGINPDMAGYGNAMAGRHEEADKIVNAGMGTETYTRTLNTILHAYATVGNHDKVREFIAKGADKIEAKIAYEETHNHVGLKMIEELEKAKTNSPTPHLDAQTAREAKAANSNARC